MCNMSCAPCVSSCVTCGVDLVCGTCLTSTLFGTCVTSTLFGTCVTSTLHLVSPLYILSPLPHLQVVAESCVWQQLGVGA